MHTGINRDLIVIDRRQWPCWGDKLPQRIVRQVVAEPIADTADMQANVISAADAGLLGEMVVADDVAGWLQVGGVRIGALRQDVHTDIEDVVTTNCIALAVDEGDTSSRRRVQRASPDRVV